MTNQDYPTFNFLQWYVSEQHEEEKLFKSIIDKLSLAGKSGEGLYLSTKNSLPSTHKTNALRRQVLPPFQISDGKSYSIGRKPSSEGINLPFAARNATSSPAVTPSAEHV